MTLRDNLEHLEVLLTLHEDLQRRMQFFLSVTSGPIYFCLQVRRKKLRHQSSNMLFGMEPALSFHPSYLEVEDKEIIEGNANCSDDASIHKHSYEVEHILYQQRKTKSHHIFGM